MPMAAAASAASGRKGSITRVSCTVSSIFPGTTLKSLAYTPTMAGAKMMPASASAPGHQHQRRQEVDAEPPGIGLAVQGQMASEGGDERGAHGAFSEEIADEVGNPERDEVRVHLVARAEVRGEQRFADEAEQTADQRRGARQARGTRETSAGLGH